MVTALHRGRTDENGGHYDHSTGEYHYHHGYPEHDHYDMDGDGKKDCPYDFKDKTNHNISSGNNSNSNVNNDSSTQANSNNEQNVTNSVELERYAKWVVILFTVTFVVIVASALFIIAKNKQYSVYSYSFRKALAQGIDKIIQSNGVLPQETDSINLNYFSIDETIRKELEIQQYLWHIQNQYNENTERLSSYITKVLIVCGITFVVFFMTVLSIFINSPFVALIIAVVLSLIAFIGAIIRLSINHEKKDETFKKETTLYATNETYKLYDKLLNSVTDLHQFLGIPSNIVFVDKLPSDASTEDALLPYGTFTRFVAPYAGKCFHQKKGCSGAFDPANLYDIIDNFTPCSKCSYSDKNCSVPEWYRYYVKLNEIIEKKLRFK